MRRWLTRISICLLIGAVTTVGVAWGIALLPEPVYSSLSPLVNATEDQRFGTFRRFPPDAYDTFLTAYPWRYHCMQYAYGPGINLTPLIYAKRFQNRLPAWSRFRNTDPLAEFETIEGFASFHEGATGWPLLSMRYECVAYLDMVIQDGEYIAVTGFRHRRGLIVVSSRTGVPDSRNIWLGFLPIWPGFAVNTILFTAIWMAVTFVVVVPFRMRRSLRTRRGRCPMCAYDLRGGRSGPAGSRTSLVVGCPECGWNRAEAESPP